MLSGSNLPLPTLASEEASGTKLITQPSLVIFQPLKALALPAPPPSAPSWRAPLMLVIAEWPYFRTTDRL